MKFFRLWSRRIVFIDLFSWWTVRGRIKTVSNEQTVKRRQVNLHLKHRLNHFSKGPCEHLYISRTKMYPNADFFSAKSETRGAQTGQFFVTEENKQLAKGPKFTYRLRQNIQLIDLPSGWFLVHFLVKTRKTIWGTVKQVPLKWAARACSKNNQSGFPRNLPPLIITLLRQALSLARTQPGRSDWLHVLRKTEYALQNSSLQPRPPLGESYEDGRHFGFELDSIIFRVLTNT